MKAIAICLLAITLVACGKKEVAHQEQVDDTPDVSCYTVKMLDYDTDSKTSLLEVQNNEETHLRMMRSGKFGTVGDVFKFCEK